MKRAVEDLAAFGGSAIFTEALHVGRPFFGDRERLLRRIEEVLDRRWMTNDGPVLGEFETALTKRIGARHVIPLANGTIGLMVLARALELSGEVIVPSFTFVATAHALKWQGIEPVFCEIDANSHNIDAGKIESLITPRTSAILAVHLWGRPCQVAEIEAIARRHGIHAIFDAAHAFDVSLDGTKIGNFGAAEVFSFHATKFVNSLEGGAIATNDDELAHRIRLMINFGFSGYDTVESVGINGKMNEFCAAMGLSTLAEIDDITLINESNYAAYQKELELIPGLSLLSYEAVENPNYQFLVVEVDEAEFGVSRDLLVRLLQRENVLARRYFYPGCHRSEPYVRSQIQLPITESVSERVLCLPIGSEISVGKIGLIGELLRFIHRNAPKINQDLMEHPVAGVVGI